MKQIVDGKTIYSIYDHSGAILTRDNATANEKTDFISLGGQTFVRVTNGTPSYPLNDHLGSAYMVADASGTITAANTYNFTPFGEGIGNDPGTLNKQGYTGHIEDETGLTYMQARYYDPIIGRFLSADPMGYSDQLNLFAYAANDPISNIDPNGMESSNFHTMNGGPFTHPGVGTAQQTIRAFSFGADFLPGIGDAKGVAEAVADPTPVNIFGAAIGFLPIAGDFIKGALKNSDVVVRGGAALPNGGNSVEGIAAGPARTLRA